MLWVTGIASVAAAKAIKSAFASINLFVYMRYSIRRSYSNTVSSRSESSRSSHSQYGLYDLIDARRPWFIADALEARIRREPISAALHGIESGSQAPPRAHPRAGTAYLRPCTSVSQPAAASA
jgi:hypothetical protein